VDKLAVARPARPEDERIFTTDRGAKAIVRRGAPGRWRDGLTKCLYLESHDGKSFHWVFEPKGAANASISAMADTRLFQLRKRGRRPRRTALSSGKANIPERSGRPSRRPRRGRK
jgi:hypothetical protein